MSTKMTAAEERVALFIKITGGGNKREVWREKLEANQLSSTDELRLTLVWYGVESIFDVQVAGEGGVSFLKGDGVSTLTIEGFFECFDLSWPIWRFNRPRTEAILLNIEKSYHYGENEVGEAAAEELLAKLLNPYIIDPAAPQETARKIVEMLRRDHCHLAWSAQHGWLAADTNKKRSVDLPWRPLPEIYVRKIVWGCLSDLCKPRLEMVNEIMDALPSAARLRGVAPAQGETETA